ncbi:MAG TPA: hypothetical protein VLI43_04605 [Gemmatimonadaceae bacterium]|nr:hypothetical protein [Gemmatimonadaceae bacterium]
MVIEQPTVSRKTPLDGRLEISESTAAQLAAFGDSFAVRTAHGSGEARLHAMSCTCAKSERTGQHVHHFVESDVLRALEPGSRVRIELDDARPGSLAIL